MVVVVLVVVELVLDVDLGAVVAAEDVDGPRVVVVVVGEAVDDGDVAEVVDGVSPGSVDVEVVAPSVVVV